MRASRFVLAFALGLCLLSSGPLATTAAGAPQTALPTPEQFFGFRIGADTKLARWDKMLDYYRLVEKASDRVRMRELGKSTEGHPFVVLEIASADTLKRSDYFRGLQRRLYLQDGVPSEAERDEIFQSGKAVVVITCSMHATEVGASQMALELVHRLATDSSPRVKHVLDNVIFLLVPSLNPDGQMMVVDWYNKNLGTEFEASSMPWLYQKYVGHDNNRDMYMFTQVESQLTAKLLWHDWFPAVWLDEHQMGSGGARIFVMPATDPINPNVHPLVYRWNGLFGQAQGAALEAAGKDGIIYNSTYTNFWQGAMAWSGWWHNQVGLLTEMASVRVASPTDQQRAQPGRPAPAAEGGRGGGRGGASGPLPAPTDVMPRTEYPRPWLGGRWTLRDIVDYELIATMATLEYAADRRETLLRQIYEVNRATVEAGRKGDPAAILITPDTQADPLAAYRLVDRLQIAGVKVYRADAAFPADEKNYPAGTFVVPMTQVFARYAKDLLEKQTYPEVRRSPTSPPEAPYDVTAWSLGMLLGVEVTFVRNPLPEGLALTPLPAAPKRAGGVTGSGAVFAFDYTGPEGAIAVNRLLKAGASVSASRSTRGAGGSGTVVEVSGVPLKAMQDVAGALGLQARAMPKRTHRRGDGAQSPAHRALSAVDRQHGRGVDALGARAARVPVHDAAQRRRAGPASCGISSTSSSSPISSRAASSPATRHPGTRPEYRGGIGEDGVAALKAFVAAGGTLVMMGNACDLAIERFPIPVRNLKRSLTRDQHFAPGTILNVEVDTGHPLGAGVAARTYGFYNNSPFFELTEGFSSQQVSVAARYPNADIVASGWLRGEEHMAGRAAVVAVDFTPGRIVLFGLRPQHRAQTQATFPMLFNSFYLAASVDSSQ